MSVEAKASPASRRRGQKKEIALTEKSIKSFNVGLAIRSITHLRDKTVKGQDGRPSINLVPS